MSVFDSRDFDDHVHVSFVCDPDAGLRAIIAIHTLSVIGTSGGGCRIHAYPSADAALRDALRLSKAMTYKLALAGLPAGGAKTVVIADPTKDKTEGLLRALGKAVHRFGGKYVIGEDVGTTPEDMEMIAKETPYVVGRKSGADSGPATGRGVFVALRTAVARALGRDDLTGIRVAVQGLGAVGHQLCRHLHHAGARLWVADVREQAVRSAVEEFGAKAVGVDEILGLDVDVVAPCALGSVLDDVTIPALRCRVVAGAANNQLDDDVKHAQMLVDRGILHAPDFVANMGGVVGASQGAGYDEAKAFAQTERIATVLDEVFDRSARQGIPPNEAAVALAKEKLASFTLRPKKKAS